MFLFFLLWNVLVIGESSNLFSTNPIPVLSYESITASEIPPQSKRKRKLPGNPDPNSEVLSLSPETLLATHRFTCKICQRGFQRVQNLHLHLRSHNIFHELKQRRPGMEIRKRVYVCPEPTCTHHHPSRALGDLTGIKKHYSRKHGEKNLRCEKCSKTYAVLGDWKAHSKICDTREYQCDCGTTFSSRESFKAHRDLCVPLSNESARISVNTVTHHAPPPAQHQAPPPPPAHHQAPPPPPAHDPFHQIYTRLYSPSPNPNPNPNPKPVWGTNPSPSYLSTTLDFLGLNRDSYTHGGGNFRNGSTSGANVGLREVLNFTEMAPYEGGDFVFAPDPTRK